MIVAPNLQCWPDRTSQAFGLAILVAQQLQAVIKARGQAHLAVPGGTTPAPFLQALGQQPIAWDKVTVTLTDERQVDADHERSNARLLQQHLLTHVPEAQFVPLYRGTDDSDLQQVKQQLEQQALPLDICVLGMGEDGHFASLFPQAKQLAEGLDLQQSEPVLVMEADNIPEPRLTLSLSALLSAPQLYLLITGPEKLRVWEQAKERVLNGQLSLPIDTLLTEAGPRLVTHYAP